MNDKVQLVVFTLDKIRFALPLSSVERAIRIMEIVPLPKAPDIVMGVVNLHGKIIPVVNIRKRFRLPQRELNLNDHLIISNTRKRSLGILVDSVSGVLEFPEKKIVDSEKILSDIEYVEGVAKLEDGIILIHDIDKFLSLEEEKAIDDAIEAI
jgi:purine-binding chemotaxis protein CheW